MKLKRAYRTLWKQEFINSGFEIIQIYFINKGKDYIMVYKYFIIPFNSVLYFCCFHVFCNFIKLYNIDIKKVYVNR